MTRKKNKPEPQRLLCALVKEGTPPVQSLVDQCGDCGRSVWHALSSSWEVEPICRSCLAEAERKGGFKAVQLPPSPQQLAEMEQVLGSRRAKRSGGSEN
jgi:hypothetical protein